MSIARFVCALVMASVVAVNAHTTRLYAAAPETPTVDTNAEVAGEAEHESGPNPLAFDPDLAIFTAVVFLLLVAILGKFAWPQITAALDERELKIADNIASAEKLQADAKRILADHEAKLAAAAGEVREMLDEARRDADSIRKRIEADGHKAAKDELDRAVREIGRARDSAVQELAVTSANVAIDLARGVVRSEISPERQKQIVQEALGKLGAAAPSAN
ncbi:MAG TPA: F0F1 ATP synthase subunit B [Lacipirellulaceae bacterium]|jgi:F-type H+-transporting ATPase subunit b|nr:F0F1 ATP synthase subunit B [Lacipirellulaceae bacterium]